MCKRLRFLISFVLLLGVAVGAYAADLNVDWPATYIVTGSCEEYDRCEIRGVVIVPAGTCLICNERSEVDGNGGDGEGGDEYAHLIVDGGEFIVRARFDMGTDHDAYVTVQNGGTLYQECCGEDWYKGIKIPDNSGGTHRLNVIDATVDAYAIEVDPDRDSQVCVGPGAEVVVHMAFPDVSNRERYDPCWWIPNGGLCVIPPTSFFDVECSCDGDECRITTPPACAPNLATTPNPADGATGVKCVNTDVVLKWSASCAVAGCPMCRHFIYFGTDCNEVEYAPCFEIGWVPPPPYQGWVPAGTTEWNVGNLPLWKNYCWRIDEGPMGPIVKGDVWTFTTGCPLIVGDLNLDCLLNLEDYAILLETWGEEQYFPWD